MCAGNRSVAVGPRVSGPKSPVSGPVLRPVTGPDSEDSVAVSLPIQRLIVFVREVVGFRPRVLRGGAFPLYDKCIGCTFFGEAFVDQVFKPVPDPEVPQFVFTRSVIEKVTFQVLSSFWITVAFAPSGQ